MNRTIQLVFSGILLASFAFSPKAFADTEFPKAPEGYHFEGCTLDAGQWKDCKAIYDGTAAQRGTAWSELPPACGFYHANPYTDCQGIPYYRPPAYYAPMPYGYGARISVCDRFSRRLVGCIGF